MKKVCQWCNQEFDAKRRDAKYCYSEHFKDCESCGESFKIASMKRPAKSCSKKCADDLTSKNTGFKKVCEFCYEEFTTKNSKARFCNNDHYQKCACGKEFKIANIHKPAKSCSKECAWKSIDDLDNFIIKRQDAFSTKYGVKNPSQLEEVKLKKEASALAKYGVRNVSQAKEVQSKRENTFLNKYGVKSSLSSPEIIQKRHATNLKKYGVKNVFANAQVKEKIKKHFQNNYGVNNPSQIPEVRTKAKNTNVKLYGVEHYPQAKPFANYPEKLKEWNDLETWAKQREVKPTIREVSQYFNVRTATVSHKISSENINRDLFKWFSSYLEEDFVKEISIIPGLQYKRNYRNLINPLEVDFFFPEHHLAIELSPTATHHSGMEEKFKNAFLSAHGENSWFIKRSVDKHYHNNKFLLCENRNVELLTYFDWMNWDKFVELVKYKLQNNSTRVHARKTRLLDLSTTKERRRAGREFINENHLMGDKIGAEFYYSLIDDNDEIIAVASFSKGGRFKKYKDDNSRSYELVRLSFKKGVSVIGGASKLVKAFVKEKQPHSLYTFSDNDIGSGKVYRTIGFNLVEDNRNSLNYVHPYVQNINTGNQWKINPVSLHSKGADRLLKNFPQYQPFGVGKDLLSNEEIVIAHGFLPVYDCGYRKWEMKFNI